MAAKNAPAKRSKGRKGKDKRAYYEAQKFVTARNKARRAAKRRKKAEFWKKVKAEAAAKANAAVNAVGITDGVVV